MSPSHPPRIRRSGLFHPAVRSLLALAALAAPAALTPLAAATSDDDTGDVHLWPLLENAQLADGGRRVWVLGLFHRTADAHDRTVSLHILDYVRSPDLSGVLPLYMRIGETRGGWHLVPAPGIAWGPGFWAAPLALSGGWRHRDGAHTDWVTPLVHWQRGADGAITSLHAGPWVQSGTWKALVPLYAQNQEGWIAPPLLSGGWHRSDGSSQNWIGGPLAHWTVDSAHTLHDLHVLTYISSKTVSGSYRLVLPLYYDATDWGERRWGVIPAVFSGPGWWTVPALLTARWSGEDGHSVLVATPAFHLSRDRDGSVSSMHCLNVIHTRTTTVVLPIAYWSGHAGHHHGAVLPVCIWGPRSWIVPPLLSAGWHRRGGGVSRWLTPALHWSTDGSHRLTSLHVLTYVQDRHGGMVLPVAWWRGEPGHRSVGVLPAWVSGPGYQAIPLALSWRARHADGSTSTWLLAPLAHRDADADGHPTSWHAGPLLHWGRTDLLLPVAWVRHDPDGVRCVVLPVYAQAPHVRVIAPFVAHGDRQAGEWTVAAPLFARWQDTWVAPLALAGHARLSRDRSITVVGPLAYRRLDAGRLHCMYILSYIRTPHLTAIAPIAWRWQAGGATHTLVAPFGYRSSHPTLGTTAAFLPGVGVHTGPRLLNTVAFQLIPFSCQRTAEGREVNVLWRALHLRQDARMREVTVAPLWWCERRPHAPLAWQVLGGVVQRTCNYRTGVSRLRVLWLFPCGSTRRFTPTTAPLGA
jgi:hypothetical protein